MKAASYGTKRKEAASEQALKSPRHGSIAKRDGKLTVKRILVPFDFSRHAVHALLKGVAIGTALGARIVLADVVPQPHCPRDFEQLPLPWKTAATQRQEQNLRVLKALTQGAQIPVEFQVRYGNVWQELIKLAEEMKVDLIVIATHGRSGLRRVLWGSVAERVIQHAPCPVLVIRPVQSDLK